VDFDGQDGKNCEHHRSPHEMNDIHFLTAATLGGDAELGEQ